MTDLATGHDDADAGDADRRPPNRRDLILAAATELFHERGYHATGVDDIGKAVDVSGPAIYRHFDSKEEILVEAMRLAADRVHTDNRRARAEASDPADVLEAFIRAYARVAIEEAALIGVWTSEVRHLTASRRSSMTKRIHNWVAEWTSVLQDLRPELTDDEATVLVGGALGLITSVPSALTGADPVELEDRIVAMATSVLRTPLQ